MASGRLRLHAAGNCLALVEQLLGTAQLADDLLGVVAFAFHGASPGQLLPIGKLSYRKDHFLGSTSPPTTDLSAPNCEFTDLARLNAQGRWNDGLGLGEDTRNCTVN